MSVEPQLLFAYGTLMTGLLCEMGRAERARLAQEARSLGPATVQGQLYDLGSYPGFVPCGVPGSVVAGELLRLFDAATTFAWLDAYEGIGDRQHYGQYDGERAEPDAYDRIVVQARLSDGTLVPAWVYRYRGPLAGLLWLREGHWSPAA